MRYHFESYSESLEFGKTIKQDYQGAKVVSLADYQANNNVLEMTGAAGKLLAVANDNDKADPHFREMVNKFVLDNLPEVSGRKAEMKRYFVKEASDDIHRAFAHTLLHGGGHDLSRIKFSHKVQDTLAHIGDQIKRHKDLVKGSHDDKPLKKAAAKQSLLLRQEDLHQITAVYNVLQKQVDAMMNPDTNALTAFSGNFAFAWYLAASPAAALVNMTQVPMVTYPILGARFGYKDSARELKTAYADIARSLKDLSETTPWKNNNVRESIFGASGDQYGAHLTEDERIMLKVLEPPKPAPLPVLPVAMAKEPSQGSV